MFSPSRVALWSLLVSCVGVSSMSYSDIGAAENPEITKLELTNALAGWMTTGISLELGDPFEVDARHVGRRRSYSGASTRPLVPSK